ncbi:MAG: barstar family protein [Rhodocyclaceae bacterium]|nr:barstar family protein [Rhodocyclaceae bacterium]
MNLLKDAGQAGVYRLAPEQAEQFAAAGEDASLRVFRVSLAAAKSVPELLDAFAQALAFPDWFGQNLDALLDCLTDLSWHEKDLEAQPEGYLLLLFGLESLEKTDPEGLRAVLEVLSAASEVWQADEVPFWVLAEARGLPEFPERG